ncbi:SNF2-related protein [Corynebacterium ulcerans]|uniref:SNF2-related protein n=1 Tax=Corynebacterium ulcerans TaxID=65058 RepID=UPI0002FE0510|nr:DEAD/DEAH box helicase [Corynebacterium ulcerans]ALD94952.1 Phage-associated protein [Corynebacterium ulcerans]BBJ72145.1 DEAD/DEAH box helicase [Corynebacterium ulcerans]BBJ74450.1 DEAD/DEAH box helicase [Corynebacterium ulcerans]SQG58804.1 non-specific serine/threonine protein kinase [Corynebacterium ulcerans]
MKYKPHSYQRFATNFIETHPQAAIFLGMGMGKTIITLTALNNLITDRYATTKALIIAPLRVARDTWSNEQQKWDHLKNLRLSIIIGNPTTRRNALNTDADIYIINRENIPWLVKELGNNWPFDTVVIDELSSFKNHKAQRFKALKTRLPKINRIIGLTGTPAPNSLEDLWAPFRLIDGGERLGKYLTHYRDKFFTPDKRNGPQIYSYKIRPGADKQIYDLIKDITVSMKTTDYLDLPPLATTTINVHLNPKERTIYNQLRDDMVTTIGTATIDAGTAGTLSNKLQQLSSGAIYTDDGVRYIHDQKLDALADIVEQASGNTILVSYWFKHELERLEAKFPQGKELSTSQDMADWCEQKIPIGFIHPASAGHGLNLQSGGHIMVWLTTPWSLELVEQTNARLFRQGQTEPVSIIHIQTSDTIDADVAKALEKKDTTQTALINAVKAQIRKEKK